MSGGNYPAGSTTGNYAPTTDRPQRGGHFDAVDDGTGGHLPGRFVAYRTLDPVRAAALANAVDLAKGRMEYGHVESPDSVIAIAKEFETYLTGEEAHDPHPPS